jgi:hypothetical protein
MSPQITFEQTDQIFATFVEGRAVAGQSQLVHS